MNLSRAHRYDIACPQCAIREPWAAVAMFDDRGAAFNGRGDIRKCRNCGIGLQIRSRRILPGYCITRIDTETWRKIELLWERDHAERAEEASPSAEEMGARVRELERLGHPSDALVQLVMESLNCSRNDAESFFLER